MLDDLLADESNIFIISFLTLYEVYYVNYRQRSKSVADFLVKSTLQLGFDIDKTNDLQEIISAGAIKGNFPLSAVDAWVAALAYRRRATLVQVYTGCRDL